MKRGFTLVELALVLTILGLLVPIGYAFGRSFEAQYHAALAQADTAQAARTVSEQLAVDLRLLRWEKDGATVLVGEGACTRVEYVVEGEALLRKAGPDCGGARALARHAKAFERGADGLVLRFERRVGTAQPMQIAYRLGVGR